MIFSFSNVDVFMPSPVPVTASILPTQYIKFSKFASIGSVGKRFIGTGLHNFLINLVILL
jgi:hypothetical protein